MKQHSELEQRVVVLTGASSGIGLAAALQFAEAGARLVLAARDAGALADAARQCEARGAEAIAVPTDVADEAAVNALRDAAVSRFGRIDVWVNDAGVYASGTVEDTPAAAWRSVLDTNVMGVVHGARAALAQFRAQGRGVLINVGSVAGKVAYAEAGAYCASKHAVHAMTEALRQELRGTGIEVCVVAPACVDTPLYDHSANYDGRRLKPMHPIYAPERVAAAIVSCARRPRREALVGVAARTFPLMQTLFPALWERVMPRVVDSDHFEQRAVGKGDGTLDAPHGPHAVHGGWKAAPKRASRVVMGVAAAAILPLAFAGFALTRR